MRKKEGRSLIAVILCISMIMQTMDLSRIVGYAAPTTTISNVELSYQVSASETIHNLETGGIEYQAKKIEPIVTINNNEISETAYDKIARPNEGSSTVYEWVNKTDTSEKYIVKYGDSTHDNQNAKINGGIVKIINEKDNSSGEIEFSIYKKDIEKINTISTEDNVEIFNAEDKKVDEQNTKICKEYTGRPIKLNEDQKDFYLKFRDDNVNFMIQNDTYKNNTEVGEASVDVYVPDDCKNYTGKKTIRFHIEKGNLNNGWKIQTLCDSYTYPGSEVRPNVEVVKTAANGENVKLEEGVDYNVDYQFNDKIAGLDVKEPPTIQVDGMGNNFEGTLTKKFVIKRCDLSKEDIKVTTEEKPIQEEKKPMLQVMLSPYSFENANAAATNQEATFELWFYTEDGQKVKWEKGIQYKIKSWDPNFEGEKGKLTIAGNTTDIIGERTIEVNRPKKQLPNDIVINGNRGEEADASGQIYYNGNEKRPTVTIKETDGTILEEKKDYTLTYANNIKPGTATIKIKGEGIYGGTVEKTFPIIPRTITDENVQITFTNEKYSYAGEKQVKPEVLNVIYKNGATDIPIGTGAYKITGYGNNNTVGKDKGSITIEGIESEGYKGTATCYFDIEKCDIANAIIKIQPLKYAGDSKKVMPSDKEISVTIGEQIGGATGEVGTQNLLYGVDYTVECTNNDKITNEAICTVTGQGNYTGTKVMKYSIKKDISAFDVKEGTEGKKQEYTGKEMLPDFKLIDKFTNAPVPESAYTITVVKPDGTTASTIKDAGVYQIKITSKDNSDYMGTREINFKLNPRIIDNHDFVVDEIPVQYYTGEEIKPDSMQLRLKASEGQEELCLKQGEDFEIVKGSKDVTQQGEAGAAVTIRAKGKNFQTPYGDVTFENCFRIERRPIVKAEGETVVANSNYTTGSTFTENGSAVVDYNFTEEGIEYGLSKPELSLTFKQAGGQDGTLTLKQGEDFELDYGTSQKDRIGKVDVTVRGIGNYSGEFPISYYIYADITDNEQIKVEQDAGMTYTYTGKPIVPFFSKIFYDYADEKLQDRVLVRDIDYEDMTQAGNNVNASNAAYAVIRGKGNCFKGQKKILFTIVPKSIEEKDVTLEGFEPEIVYNGQAAEQDVKLTFNGMTLKEGKDYDITYSKSEAERVHVTGKNEDGSDQTIQMTVTGKGNYCGSKTYSFQIVPCDITPTDKNKNTITPVTWSDSLEYTGEPVEQDSNNLRAMMYQSPDSGMINVPMNYGTEEDLKGEKAANVDYTVSYKDDHTQVGDTAVILTGHGDYTGTYEIPYVIYANLENTSYTSWEEMPDVPYAGGAYVPKVSIICAGKELTIGNDADADATSTASGDNINVTKEDLSNQPTLTVTGNGTYYRGSIQKKYRIVPKNLSDAVQDKEDISIAPVEDTTYTGKEIKPQIQVYNHGNLMKEGEDYTLELDLKNDNINVGEKNVTLKAGTGSNYTGSIPLKYQILPRDIGTQDGILVVEGIENKVYNGKVQKQDITKVTYANASAGMEEVRLVEGRDYVIQQNENIQIGQAKVTIKGMGNYTGTKDISYEITNALLDDAVLTVDTVTYNGNPQTPSVKVEKAGEVLKEGVDYVITGYENNVHAKTAEEKAAPKVKIEGRGGFLGAKAEQTFTILPSDLSQDQIKVIPPEDREFNGMEQTPVPTVKKNGVSLEKEKEFTLEYQDNLHAGTATVKIKGCGDYTGTIETHFKITPVSLNNPAITLEKIKGQDYTGSPVIPTVTIVFTNPATKQVYTLKEGVDYKLTAENNISSGEAKLHIEAISGGTFMGSLDTTFVIKKDLGTVQTPDILPQVYDGQPVEPEVTLYEKDQTLDQGTIYTVRYENNAAAGTGEAICEATPDSPYSGSIRIPFKIFEKIAGRIQISGLTKNGFAYTGKPIRPDVKVSIGNRVLDQSTDYSISYANDTEIGTARLTVNGRGLYIGTHSVSYKIIPRSIASAETTNVSDKQYQGKPIKPEVQVSMNGKILKKDVDYSIKYDHNVNPGTAGIILTGKGNYEGSKVIRFSIKIPAVGGVNVAALQNNKLKLSWKKGTRVSGYEIYTSANKLVKKVKGNSYVVKNLKGGTTYKYKIRAYVKADGKVSYGAFSTLVTGITRPDIPKVKLKSKKAKQMTISWKKVTGASGYEIYRSSNGKSSSYKKVKTIKKGTTVSYTNKKLAAKKMYYYKIRAYKTVKGTKLYGGYSKVKAAQTK